ncbi:MAG: hypothetical protein IJN56_05035 [Clostridia bacterium]|nr:hypothetical protein [Clostridia bacterium]
MKRILSILLAISLVAGMLCGNLTVMATTDSVKVEKVDFYDYTASWGRSAFQIMIDLSKDFTTSAAGSYITADYADYITINGINMADRNNNPADYGVQADYCYPNGSIAVQPYPTTDVITLTMQGGGIGNIDVTTSNTIVISKDMPMADGTTLGRNIALSYDPATNAWSEGVTVEKVDFYDYTEAWGRSAFQIMIDLSKDFTTSAAGSYITADYADYITINGVNMADRNNNPADFGVQADYCYPNGSIAVQPYPTTDVITLTMQGGGEGNINPSASNIIILDAALPMADGTTLGREIVLIFDPETQTWAEGEKPSDVTAAVTQFADYTEAWGRSAFQIYIDFSKDFTTAAQYAYITENYASYITVNGINMADRNNSPADLGVQSDYCYPNGAVSVQPDTPDVMILQMQGGGNGNLDFSTVNYITLSKLMPMADGSYLGRDITLVFDPETQSWAEGEVPVSDASAEVIGFFDQTASWGRSAYQLFVKLSDAYTDAAQYSYLTADFAQYITINGANMSDRNANPAKYRVDSDFHYDNGPIAVQNDTGDIMIFTMQGGGEGMLDASAVNAITISQFLPLLNGGTLGRDITLVYDPATQTWAEGEAPDFDLDLDDGSDDNDEPEQPPQVTDPINVNVLSTDVNDFSSSRGMPDETFFQINIVFEEAFTNEAVWSYFTETLGQYIEINGVNMKDRYENPADYNIGEIPEDFYGGKGVAIQNGSKSQLTILLIGGGDGNIVLSEKNTLVIKAGFPFVNGILENDIVMESIPTENTYSSWNVTSSGGKSYKLLDDEWVRDEKNLITNFYSMYHPEVVYVKEWDDGENYPYLMYFFGWACNQENDAMGTYPGYPGGDAIFMARAKSVEGPWEVYAVDRETGENYWDTEQKPITWEPVVTCQDKWYDNWHVGDPSVVYEDGKFYMAYSAMGTDQDGIFNTKENDTDGVAACIMGATSTDGINWTQTDEPLLIWQNEKGFDEVNDINNYLGGYQRPSLMLEDGKWRMWFDLRYNEYGYAECDGDFTMAEDWTEVYGGDNRFVDENGMLFNIVDMDVIKVDGKYYMYGDPYMNWYGIVDDAIPYYPSDPSNWSNRQIVEFVSEDGITWKLSGYFRPDSDTDANQIPQIFFDEKGNRLCLFYATQRGMQGDGSYDWRWNNIRMMYKRLGSSAIDRTESEEITVTIKDGIADLSKDLGLEAGKAMEITLQFSDSITTAADGTIITDELSSFITINGVTLDRRMEGDRKLKMDTIPDEIYDGYNVVITSENGGKTIKVLLLGGGEGNLVADAANTILISEDLPIKNGNVLGKGANFYYNPATDKWEATEASNNDETKSPDTSDSTMPFAVAVASVIASAAVIFTGKKKIAKNSKA